jgi:hypothetical protein
MGGLPCIMRQKEVLKILSSYFFHMEVRCTVVYCRQFGNFICLQLSSFYFFLSVSGSLISVCFFSIFSKCINDE